MNTNYRFPVAPFLNLEDLEQPLTESEQEAGRRRRRVSRTRVVRRPDPPGRRVRFPQPGIRFPLVGVFPGLYNPDYPGAKPEPPVRPERPTPEPGSQPSSGEPVGGQPAAEPIPQGSERTRWLQSSLNAILGLQLPVDGVMSPELRKAVKSFQEKMRLPADGIVGPDTEQAIIKARQNQVGSGPGVSTPDSQSPPDQSQAGEVGFLGEIGSGNHRSQVYIHWVQQNLNRILGTNLSVDGRMGRQTRAAIMQFQQQNGLRPDGVVDQQTEQALIRSGSGNPPGASTQTIQTLKGNIVRIALQEHDRWARGAIKERDPRNLPVLQDYWARGPHVRFSLAELSNPAFQAEHPWSAAFISWVMRQSGAGTAFRYSAAHANYIKAAKDNRLANNANPFKAYRINEIRPQVGDLVCKSRAGSGANYENIRPGQKTHCDIVVSKQGNRLMTIGGNVNNSVSMTPVTLDADGYINQAGYFAVIRIGENGVQASPSITIPVQQPSTGQASPTAVIGAPRLIRQEVSPPGQTLYLEIDLGLRDKQGRKIGQPVTGVFIPQGYTPGASVDLIVYLHGFKQPSLTIDQYWNSQRPKSFPLREMTNNAGKNVILVAPTLGFHSQSGKLTQVGGFDAYIDAILAGLRAYGPFRLAAPRLGSLILACHSGGGWPMRQIASSSGRYSTNIRELWGFDCTYNSGDDQAYARWARAQANRRVYIYYIANSRTAVLSQSLQRLNQPNVTVIASSAGGHNAVPGFHWTERVRGAPNLPGIISGSSSQRSNEMPAWRNLAWGGV